MQYAVSFSPIVLLTSPIFHSHPLLAPRAAITQRLDAALRRWSASPHQFFFHLSRLTANRLEAKRGLTTELFSPAPVHRSHPFFHTLSRSQLIKFAICRTRTTYRLSGWPDISFHQSLWNFKTFPGPAVMPMWSA